MAKKTPENEDRFAPDVLLFPDIAYVLSAMSATAPVRDYSLADIQAFTRYSARQISRYIEMGFVPRPHGKGRSTRYSREALGRLVFILVRRGEGDRTSQFKHALESFPSEQAEAYAESVDPMAPAPVAPADAVPVRVIAPPVSPPAPAPSAPLAAMGGGKRWLRVALVPGLELMVCEEGGELVARLAREIVEKYGTG